MMKKVFIVLEDGHIFEGKSFGAEGEALGELVFTTGMGGYIETLTDPSYYGQIVMQTFPLIGNYGIMEEDFESDKSYVSGYVVREWCEMPSNFRTEYDLDAFLKKQGIVGVYGVDTREITRIIREKGVMNARIVSSLDGIDYDEIKAYRIVDAVKSVSCKEKYTVGDKDSMYKVALMDYGAKKNIVRELVARGCEVTVMPYDTPAEDIIAMNPDGIMLSNGPGDPEENIVPISNIKELVGKFPIFGICLGHQLTALAMGGKTMKLKYGHRGVNQPVKQLETGRTYISSQNHGYAVVADSLDRRFSKESFINANDGTCEGMEYRSKSIFTVQFHPEACSGPKDTKFLFDRFISMMGGKDNAAE